MKIQASTLITNMAGSVNGQTIRRSRYGLVLQKKAYTPSSSHQLAQSQKQIFSRVSFMWKQLNSLEIKYWESVAYDNPVLDRFGNYITLSGFAYFKKVQQNALNSGMAIVPAGTYAPEYDTITNLSVLQTGAQKYDINYDKTFDYAPQIIKAFAVVRGNNSSVAFDNKRVGWKITNGNNTNGTIEVNLLDQYNYPARKLAFGVYTLTERGGRSPIFWGYPI